MQIILNEDEYKKLKDEENDLNELQESLEQCIDVAYSSNTILDRTTAKEINIDKGKVIELIKRKTLQHTDTKNAKIIFK